MIVLHLLPVTVLAPLQAVLDFWGDADLWLRGVWRSLGWSAMSLEVDGLALQIMLVWMLVDVPLLLVLARASNKVLAVLVMKVALLVLPTMRGYEPVSQQSSRHGVAMFTSVAMIAVNLVLVIPRAYATK